MELLIWQVFSRISPPLARTAIIFNTRSYLLLLHWYPFIHSYYLVFVSSVISVVVPRFRHLLYFISILPISRFPASKQTMYPPSIHASPFSLHNLMNYVVILCIVY